MGVGNDIAGRLLCHADKLRAGEMEGSDWAEQAALMEQAARAIERLEKFRHKVWAIVHNAQKLGWVSNDHDALEAALEGKQDG